MKKYNFRLLILSLVVVLASSCESWIDSDMNVSPNSPSDVPMNLILPAAQAGIAYSAGGELSRYSCIWMQQVSGTDAHALGYGRYILTEADMDNLWKWYTYAGTLMDLKRILDKSVEEGKESPHYSAVAKILTAYKLGVTTDVWNDIPYEDAFQGETTGQLTAAYHSQEKVYEIMNTMIDEAIVELDATESVVSPGGEDLIYGYILETGETADLLALWKKAAYALKARFAIHLSERNGAAAYTAALAAASNAFTSNADDLEFAFKAGGTEHAPLFQYDEQRPDYIAGLGVKMIELLKNGGDTDPRLAVYAEENVNGEYVGQPAGAPITPFNLCSRIGEHFLKNNATVPMMTYVELKFIEAEANFQLGNAGPAATAYNDAVKASLAKYGVSNVAWEAANAAADAGTITLEMIMTAKYIATFLQGETFTDWRRHDNIIGLTLAANANETEIPRRFPYPTNERVYNSENMPEYGSITSHVWWDVN